MILHTLELTGNEPSYEELIQRISVGEFDDVVAVRSFLILTTDAGIVKVNKDKTITPNILIDADEVVATVVTSTQFEEWKQAVMEEVTSKIDAAIQLHESSYHNSTEGSTDV